LQLLAAAGKTLSTPLLDIDSSGFILKRRLLRPEVDRGLSMTKGSGERSRT
jgi:hypothetical protein